MSGWYNNCECGNRKDHRARRCRQCFDADPQLPKWDRRCEVCGRPTGAALWCRDHVRDLSTLSTDLLTPLTNAGGRCYDNTMPLQVSEDMAATREKGA